MSRFDPNSGGWNRREFLAGIGKGAVGVGLGASLLGHLCRRTALAKEGTQLNNTNLNLLMSMASSSGGVVASANWQASQVGIDVLDRGGNAVDAAIATVFAVAVARPDFNSIGGGGFLVSRSRDGSVHALDFREFAPLAATPTTFTDPANLGGQDPRRLVGHLTVGVPGSIAGMSEAHRELGSGKFRLDQLISAERNSPTPGVGYAYELARDGITVTFELVLFAFFSAARLAANPEAARVYGGIDALWLTNWQLPTGVKLKQEDYAKSLKLIMELGPEAFYVVKDYPGETLPALPRESIAKLIIRDMQTTGRAYSALMTADDLAAYKAVWRKPLVGRYRGHEIIAMPPPTSGGIATIQILNLLDDERFPLGSTTGDVTDTRHSWAQSSANHLHVLAESQKIAWADRDYFVGDPDHVPVPTDQLITKDYADSRRGEIVLFGQDAAKADYPRSSESWAPTWPNCSGASNIMHTTHVSVLDRDGVAVSVTHTIGDAFGAAVVAPGTGFPLNNHMLDFNVEEPCAANSVGSRKRPRSSQTPTIVARDGRTLLATGGGGGPWIPLAVVQNIVNMIDFPPPPDSPYLHVARAIDAERIEARAHGKEGTTTKEWTKKLTVEPQRLDSAVIAELGWRGHVLTTENNEYGANISQLEAVMYNPVTGLNEAASDPRHNRNFAGHDEEKGAMGQRISDIRVTNITASNNPARQGEKVTITAIVANTGSVEAGASKTEFLLDNTTVLGLVDTPLIPTGAAATISVNWDTRSVKGEHTIRVTADKTGLVAEGNEDNNAATLTVTVKGNMVADGAFE